MAYWEFRKRLHKNVGFSSFLADPYPNRNQRHWMQYEAFPLVVKLQMVPAEDLFEVTGMARSVGYGNLEFIAFKLQADEKALFNAWWTKEEKNAAGILQDLMNSGYKVSITPDFDNACTIVTLIGKLCIPENKDRAYSSRADGWHEAFGLMAYKHFVLSSAKAWPDSAMADNWG